MDYSCADREPVQLDRWDDTSNKISAKDQTIRKAVQREKSDSDTEDAVRFRPDERPLKQRPGDACPDDEPEKRDRNRDWSVADDRYAPRHGDRMDTTPIRPIPGLICDEWPHNNLANGGVENGRNRFGRRHCLVIVVVDEPAMVREVMSNERECHLRSP